MKSNRLEKHYSLDLIAPSKPHNDAHTFIYFIRFFFRLRVYWDRIVAKIGERNSFNLCAAPIFFFTISASL